MKTEKLALITGGSGGLGQSAGAGPPESAGAVGGAHPGSGGEGPR